MNPSGTSDGTPRIRLRGLVKHFGKEAALRGIDLDVDGAQVLGVVGPDGAGKTTLLRCLAGLLEVEADGTVVVAKLPGTGGIINRAICAEQMIYEIHDPANYITPDVVVDFTEVELDEIGPDRVRIRVDQIGDQPRISL